MQGWSNALVLDALLASAWLLALIVVLPDALLPVTASSFLRVQTVLIAIAMKLRELYRQYSNVSHPSGLCGKKSV